MCPFSDILRWESGTKDLAFSRKRATVSYHEKYSLIVVILFFLQSDLKDAANLKHTQTPSDAKLVNLSSV